MKLIIAGTRTFNFEHTEIAQFLGYFSIHPYSLTQVVSGGARGVDKSGEEFANVYISDKPEHLKVFPAEWDKYGIRAGPIRNNKMAVYADALLLIWDGSSSGSQHMKNAMIEQKKPIYEIIIRKAL